MNRSVIGVAAVLAAVFASLFAWRWARTAPTEQFAPPPTAVAAIVVEPEALPRSLEAVGTLQAVREVMLAPETAGRVVAIRFEAGSHVEEGAPIVQLYDEPERADRAAAQARADLARAQLARSQSLAYKGAESQQLLDQRKAELDQALAEIKQLDARIAQKTVRAPFSGDLGIRRVNPGQYVNAGDPIATLTSKAAAWQSGLFAFVDSDLAFDNLQARVTIDRAKAGELGVSMREIADTLAVLVGENYINRFNWHDRSCDVITQVPKEHRLSPENIGRYYVKAASDELVPLATVVRVDMKPEANRLPQFNQMNSVTLSAVLAPGATMGQAVKFLERQPIPPGATRDWLGDSRQYVQEGNQLTISFGFALVVIFLVLAAQFESWRDPLVILVTVPLAVVGALVPLYLGFTTINIYTQIGLVTLIGLISKHGILMVSFANEIQKREDLERYAAIEKAAAVRMRPVLMTTAAMVAGLLPLLIASGAGASSRFAIGIVVVMGMLVGTVFTLFVVPTIYTLVARDHRPSAVSERERELEAASVPV